MIKPETNATTAVVPYRLHSSRMGAPTLYDPIFCEEIIHYFSTAITIKMQLYEESVEKEILPGFQPDGPNFKGKHKAMVRAVSGDMPTLERFANSLGVSTSTLYAWGRKYPDFAFALERAREMQKDIIVQGLVSGRMPAHGGIFVAKNLTDMVDDRSLVIKQGTVESHERPVLANKTPVELQQLRELAEKCRALGFTLELTEMQDESSQTTRGAEGEENAD